MLRLRAAHVSVSYPSVPRQLFVSLGRHDGSMNRHDTSMTHTTPLRPRRTRWFAAGVTSLAILGASTGTAFAATGGPSSHSASHASVGMAHRNEHAKGAGSASDAKGAASGGPVARDHASSCDLAGATALSVNWNHGAYVRAARAAGTAAVRAGAKSQCGKPMSAHGA